jgi:hypothetical protein
MPLNILPTSSRISPVIGYHPSLINVTHEVPQPEMMHALSPFLYAE